MSAEWRVGLVLSGGGAKGAYQAGVVKALSELGAQVDAIAGASIGALNGAVLAAAPSLEVGAQHLEELWTKLAESSPLEFNRPAYLDILLAAGSAFRLPFLVSIIPAASAIIPALKLPALEGALKIVDALSKQMAGNEANDGVLSNGPLRRLMDDYLDADKLNNGTPLYVSAYPTASIRQDLLGIIRAELGLGENQHAEFFHVQAQALDEQRKILLASAAIPMLFAPQEINGKIYTDGGQGGWSTVQGNTPIQPLLDAGYKNILVTHLSNGSLWSRQKFPDATILEIRPCRSISRSTGPFGGAKDLLGFDRSSIRSLIEQGYEDTLHCVGRVRDASNSRRQLGDAQRTAAKAEDALQGSEQTMRDAMRRLTGG